MNAKTSMLLVSNLLFVVVVDGKFTRRRVSLHAMFRLLAQYLSEGHLALAAN